MLPILFAAYGAVFVAEIVGDKLLYTTGVLATRYRTAPILCGMAIAFMAKMGVAVLVGKAISKLPPLVVAAITTVNLFAIAYVLWRKPDRGDSKKDYPASRAMMVSFAAIFFSEWGDIGRRHPGGALPRAARGLDWGGGRHGHQRRAGGFRRRRHPAVDPVARFTKNGALRGGGCAAPPRLALRGRDLIQPKNRSPFGGHRSSDRAPVFAVSPLSASRGGGIPSPLTPACRLFPSSHSVTDPPNATAHGLVFPTICRVQKKGPTLQIYRVHAVATGVP